MFEKLLKGGFYVKQEIFCEGLFRFCVCFYVIVQRFLFVVWTLYSGFVVYSEFEREVAMLEVDFLGCIGVLEGRV